MEVKKRDTVKTITGKREIELRKDLNAKKKLKLNIKEGYKRSRSTL